ncbi:MAG: LamG-like jellyroll fold domain-containing protein [Bacteroidota bacterium]
MNKFHLRLVLFVGLMLAGPSLFLGVVAQSLHALSFDGTDDYTATPGFSSQINGLNSFSMACWVNPANTAPSFPNFDGIMGLRNDLNADFYLLHYSNNAYEARFRNSAGTNYTITQGPVQLNTWQHLALVYTGSQLRLFRNGTLLSSISASGSINNPNVSLEIGRLSYANTPYYLEGMVDEAAFWGRALSDAEVLCLYKQQLDTASTGLLAYYSMDQGQAGGNNVTVPYLEDLRNGFHAYFYGLNLNGPSSNFVNGRQMMGVIRDTLCRGGSLSVGGVPFNQGGTYRLRLPRPDQCDSTLWIGLYQDTADRRLTQNRNQLTAVQNGALSYQWLQCTGSPTPIPGATSRTYTATANGSYRVAIRRLRCVDTSYCAEVRTVDLPEISMTNQDQLTLWPNPGSQYLNVQLPNSWRPWGYRVVNALGQTVAIYPTNDEGSHDEASKITLNTEDWPTGWYTLWVGAQRIGGAESPTWFKASWVKP